MNTENVITAEELMLKHIPSGTINLKPSGPKVGYQTEKTVITTAMIEFAKLHLKAAIEEIKNKLNPKFEVGGIEPFIHHYEVDTIDEIINAYPENLIK